MNVSGVKSLLNKSSFTKSDLIYLLSLTGDAKTALFEKAAEVKEQYVGRKVYFRGLIELSNICRKNCLYCGIRSGNSKVSRYNLDDEEVVETAKFAWQNKYASLAIQTGELNSNDFIERINNLLNKINKATNNELGITLSLGEQTEKTYQEWFDKGAIRYLLRIESSNRNLYHKIHPNNLLHDYDTRLNCLKSLQRIGYQVGSGIMIGLPFQTLEHLAEDLLWMQEFDIDMVGMGPYVEHPDTPLFEYSNTLLPLQERLDLSLKMYALLRILMKDINIAAPTALQAIDPLGREKAIKVGANVIMPNITPGIYRNNYKLYENKPCVDDAADDCKSCLEARIQLTGDEIGFGEQGNSKHYYKKIR